MSEQSQYPRRGGMAGWSITHPIGIIMITLALFVVGILSYQRLSVDLLPHIIYPDIRIRVLDPGVPATIMEDRITRQLEEQLAITEDVISVESNTSEGRSAVNLSFNYGKDIDIALRDASTRLDRAKRFLPASIEPPIIYKRDPSQRPVVVFVVSSTLKNPVQLRTWVDDVLGKWLLTSPGVAAAEVGGGLVREIQVLPDQRRLAGLGLTTQAIIDALKKGNLETPAGRIHLSGRELSSRTSARYKRLDDIANLPIRLPSGSFIPLRNIAKIIDTHQDQLLRVRLNGIPGVKLSIQKQPNANTVDVVENVRQRIAFLKQQGLIPKDITITATDDQSVFVKRALENAKTAAIGGALLAMFVVYLFLGDIRRTLIIGSAIPVAIAITFLLMDISGLTLNIMTLGGLAVGIGMLVDSTIVMLENIYRHQKDGEGDFEAGRHAAIEVNSAIVASTSTNLAAIVPFLFISGLVGLLFNELIITITSAMIAAMLIALTLVPALSCRVHNTSGSGVRVIVDRFVDWLQQRLQYLLAPLLERRSLQGLLIILFTGCLAVATLLFASAKQDFLPTTDEGEISIRITLDPGVNLDTTDKLVKQIEDIVNSLPAVTSVNTLSGGFIFGRTEVERHNKAYIVVTLAPVTQRKLSSGQWLQRFYAKLGKARLVGVRIHASVRGMRGLRLPISRGNDAVSLRILGNDLEVLEKLADRLAARLSKVQGIRNIVHSLDETRQEISIKVDRERAAELKLTAEDIGIALRTAINGTVATDFIEGDKSYDIRVRLPRADTTNIQSIGSLLLFHTADNTPVYVSDVAKVELIQAPASIQRDSQRRIVEVNASLLSDVTQGQVDAQIRKILDDFPLPDGYSIYDAGISKTLKEGKNLISILLPLAIFLVFVVMAIQYESLLNPLVIMFSIPFTLIGVAIGLKATGLPLTMPVWLGLIMLAGIVVNNAIVLVEYIELIRRQGMAISEAILEAVRLRLRPILMTTLTTIAGLAPLAIAYGEGAEMLQPLAVTIVFGLTFSLLVSLFLVPVMYQLFHRRQPAH